jgi:outer membrane protein TolC
MQRIRNATFALLIFSSFPAFASAQQPLSEFLAGSDTASIDLRTSDAARHAAWSQTDIARARFLPSFTAQGIYQRNEYQVQLSLACFDDPVHPPNVPCANPGPPATIQLYDQLTANFQLSVPIIDVQGWQSFFASEETARAADERVDSTRQDVRAQVIQVWHGLVAAHAVRDAAQHNYDAVAASRDNVQARFDAEVAPQLDLSRAEAEVLRAQQTIAEADRQIVLAERNLELLTGIHPTSAAQALDDDLHEEQALEEYTSRVHDAPLVRAAARSVHAAEMSVDAAWEGFIPTVGGTAREVATNASGFSPSTQWALLLTATWTLDFLRPAQIGLAGDQLASAHAQEDGAVQLAETRVFEQWHRVRSLRIAAQAATGARDALQRADQDAHARYEAGAATQLEVITADRDLLQAEVARIGAIANLAIARRTLHLRAGLEE